MKTIAIVAEKGGTGKTTTSQALVELLRAEGYRVLAIDLDQQANLSFALNIESAKYDIYDILTKKVAINKAIYQNSIKATEQLSLLDKEPLTILRDALKQVANNYDFAILDTPPKLDKNILRALIATDYVLIPTFADAFSYKGITKLLKIIDAVKNENKDIKILGVLFTMYNNRNILNKQLKELIEDKCKQNNIYCFKTTINRNIAISEAQAMQKALADYNDKSKAIKDYKAFIKEFLEILK